jgi:hypothetical protein
MTMKNDWRFTPNGEPMGASWVRRGTPQRMSCFVIQCWETGRFLSRRPGIEWADDIEGEEEMWWADELPDPAPDACFITLGGPMWNKPKAEDAREHIKRTPWRTQRGESPGDTACAIMGFAFQTQTLTRGEQ